MRNLKKLGLSALFGTALLAASSSADASTFYNYTFDGSGMTPPFSAQVSLDVVGGQAISGTGTINFSGNLFDLTLITLATPGGNYGGTVGFRDNHGTDLFGADTVVPIDGACCGLLFAITNNPQWGLDALLNVWNNGGNNFGYLISGTLPSIFNVYINTSSGTGDLAITPLPSTWLMLLAGFIGFGFLAHRSLKTTAVPSAV